MTAYGGNHSSEIVGQSLPRNVYWNWSVESIQLIDHEFKMESKYALAMEKRLLGAGATSKCLISNIIKK